MILRVLRRLSGRRADDPLPPICPQCTLGRMVFEAGSAEDVRCPRCGHRAWMPKPKERP